FLRLGRVTGLDPARVLLPQVTLRAAHLLDEDRAAEVQVGRLIDPAHAARVAEHPHDVVTTVDDSSFSQHKIKAGSGAVPEIGGARLWECKFSGRFGAVQPFILD